MSTRSKTRPTTEFITENDLYLFNEGTHSQLYKKLGCHLATNDGVEGAWFSVWAPNARAVSVVADFNGWERGKDTLQPRASSGIWTGFIPGVTSGQQYKYAIDSHVGGAHLTRADPVAFATEVPPNTASVTWDLDYEWGDSEWMERRGAANSLDAPMAVYEVHLGSWRRNLEEGNRSLTYREHADILVDYVAETGFTHVEFLPVMEHPFGGSWGYQVTGYFAPTSRFGSPQDFMYLVDRFHQRGIGVILDWVPSHFPADEHGLGRYDGSHLYEHADPRRGVHADWGSLIFNYGRHEVRSFLLSSAVFWLDKYHVDGLRVDAVASMLYLDYSRKEGEWIPNQYGGREDLDAVEFLRQLNIAAYGFAPDVQLIAEESTAWPMVSRPTYLGGLGFGMKWDMGWMHDTLDYMARDPIIRRYHHNQLTFRGLYAFTENYMLPLSHDEVVHGKGSLLRRMSGDNWQKFANLRALFAYMYTLPGKKLLFMGGEVAQWDEWNHETSISWDLLQYPEHDGIRRLIGDLNALYRRSPALYETDNKPEGFEWIDANDGEQSTLSFLRRSGENAFMAVLCNFTPVPRHNFRAGVPMPGHWEEVLNTDAPIYGGSGQGNLGGVETTPIPANGRPQSIVVTLPPLSVVAFRWSD
ncbi:MAG: 1,4-alpha-glucan branching protein GlgB [Dehalococcoidia bacterium]